MNRRELWCERTTTFRTKYLGGWHRRFPSGESETVALELHLTGLRATKASEPPSLRGRHGDSPDPAE
jgi:hypothetical protein